jgi:hypothetical protein
VARGAFVGGEQRTCVAHGHGAVRVRCEKIWNVVSYLGSPPLRVYIGAIPWRLHNTITCCGESASTTTTSRSCAVYPNNLGRHSHRRGAYISTFSLNLNYRAIKD